MGEAQFEECDDLVYHYTDQFGLAGIIQRGEIWATNASYLKDVSEIANGVDYFGEHNAEALKALIESRQLESRFSERYRKVLEYLISEADRMFLKRDPKEYLFVSSFFDSCGLRNAKGSRFDPGDVLEQWRAYSKEGVGYSIGFQKKSLESHVAKWDGEDDYTTFCGGCIYSEEEKIERTTEILEILEPACEIAMRVAYEDWREYHRAVTSPRGSGTSTSETTGLTRAEQASKDRESVLDNLQLYWGRKMVSASFMKHEAFATEHEWRIVRLAFTSSEQVQFRPAKDGILPYSAISIANDDSPGHLTSGIIRRIVIGPQSNVSRSKLERDARSVKMLLEHYGLEIRSDSNQNGVTIERSVLPC